MKHCILLLMLTYCISSLAQTSPLPKIRKNNSSMPKGSFAGNTVFNKDQKYFSEDSRYFLQMQSDGNLVI